MTDGDPTRAGQPFTAVSDPATPSSPEPQELTEALDESRNAWWSYGCWLADSVREGNVGMPPFSFDRIDAARSVLLALYNRQREEIERWRECSSADVRFAAEINEERISLSSQLERLTEENGRLTAQLDGCHNSRNFSDAELERLKAEQLTPEEARAIVDSLFEEDLTGQAAYEAYTRGFVKLRRLSQQGDTKE